MKKYVKIKLDLSMEMSPKLFDYVMNNHGFLDYLVRNMFHNQAWMIRYKEIEEITEQQFKTK